MIATSATLGGFRGPQSIVLGPHRRMEADRDQGRHVERLAQRGAAAANAPLAAVLAGIAGDRGEAGEARGALVRESAELGQLDQQGERGGFADAGDAHQNSEARLQGGVGDELGAERRRSRRSGDRSAPNALWPDA